MSNVQSVFTAPERSALRSEIKERAVTPREILQQLKSKRPVERDALIAVDRTRWMIIAFIAIALCIGLFMMYANANKQLQNNTRLVYVRMYPEGHWDIDFYDGSGRGVEFLPSTVDSLITQFIQRRFQEIRHSVGYDYGFAQLFMAPRVAKEFVDPQQGNAVARAAEIKECARCPEKQIEVGVIDHFDAEKTTFGQAPGALYRTNIFVLEKLIDENGRLVGGKARRKIVSLQWRLMSKAEIQASLQKEGGVPWLRHNPIGLQVMNYEIHDDPSDNFTSSKQPAGANTGKD